MASDWISTIDHLWFACDKASSEQTSKKCSVILADQMFQAEAESYVKIVTTDISWSYNIQTP